MYRIITKYAYTLPKGTIFEVLGTTKDDRWHCKVCLDNREFFVYIADIAPLSEELIKGV